MKGVTDETANNKDRDNQLKEAKYSGIKMELKQMKPIAAVCSLEFYRYNAHFSNQN